MPSHQNAIRSEHRPDSLQDALRLPVGAMLGVSEGAVKELRALGIETIFDLGCSWLLANASAVVEAATVGGWTARIGTAPSDLLNGHAGTPIQALADLPVGALRGIPAEAVAGLAAALDVNTIRELASWPPRLRAKELVAEYAGTSAPVDPEWQQSEELRPRIGEYPTERVYYSAVVMLGEQESSTHEALEGPASLEFLSTRASGFTRPAVGAIVTYRQSWYVQGITLGHLLHSLALAPGECTRVAVIDWSRRTSTFSSETIGESEDLDNEQTHGRAISEIQGSVAREIGGGGSSSRSGASSKSEAVGESSSSGAFESVFFGSSSSGWSNQKASSNAWAEGSSWTSGKRSVMGTMSQAVNDKTEQHSSIVRNRRASAVREVAQSEHEQISTRVVANYNHMHALSVQYFEVVQIYRVAVEVHRADRVLFVPLALVDFSAKTAPALVQRFRGPLLSAALNERAAELLVHPTSIVEVIAEGPPREVRPSPGTPIESPISRHKAALDAWRESVLGTVGRADPRRRRGSGRGVPFPEDTELVAVSVEGLDIKSVRLGRGGGYDDGVYAMEADKGMVEMPFGTSLTSLENLSLATATTTEQTGTLRLVLRYLGRRFETEPMPVVLRGSGVQRVLRFDSDRSVREEELMLHLGAHQEHYSRAIFRGMDPSTIVMLLSQYRWNGKALIDQVEPKPLAVIGNYLVLRAPVSPDEGSGITSDGQEMTWDRLLDSRGITSANSDERLVPVPTGGVFAEAVLGRANCAEKLDITRFWNWQDSPIPLTPTEIAPIATGSRATSDELKPGQLSAPVLNIVNPTSMPDPTGLGAILGAVSNGSMFRDMSGLAGTQALVGTGMTGTLKAATEAGQLASANLRTEAEKQVAMSRVVADLVKSAIGAASGAPSAGGVSGEGARINHGRDMDVRGVPGPSTPASTSSALPVSAAPGPGKTGSSGGNTAGASVTGSSPYSHETTYADRGALGYSPSAIAATTNSSVSGEGGGGGGGGGGGSDSQSQDAVLTKPGTYLPPLLRHALTVTPPLKKYSSIEDQAILIYDALLDARRLLVYRTGADLDLRPDYPGGIVVARYRLRAGEDGRVVLRPVFVVDHLYCEPAPKVELASVRAEARFFPSVNPVDSEVVSKSPRHSISVQDDAPKYVGHGLPLQTQFEKGGLSVYTGGDEGLLRLTATFGFIEIDVSVWVHGKGAPP